MIENKANEGRKIVIISIIVLVGIIFATRLFYIQVINDKYVLSANNNVLRYITQYPARGLVYDRTGELIVFNEAAYDLMVVPKLVKTIDTFQFCRLIGIDKDDFIRKMKKAKGYSYHKASIFEDQISKESYGYIEEKLYKYPGFWVQPRTLRKYPIPSAAHLLGYIGEVSPMEIEANPYYAMGDYIGKSGIEKAYESELGGKKGLKISMVDVFNREKGSYQQGAYDTLPIPGNDLYISLDIELQAYGEKLMQNKKGSIVAIEPSTGEILALISSPTYDPNLLIGRIRSKNYSELYNDSLKPLFNRALLAMYSPGSTFKTVEAPIALQEGVVTPQTTFSCGGVDATPIKCSHNHYSPLNLIEAIEQSCNPYYWNVFRKIIENRKYANTREAYVNWKRYVNSFNLGLTFNSDLNIERGGNVPNPEYYDKYFGKGQWRSMTIRSLSIGQGELLVTPLQLCNVAAIIANRGYYYTPHLVRSISRNKQFEEKKYEKKYTLVEPRNFDPVVEGMYRAYSGSHGTARRYQMDTIMMCGKTGTVQNPHGENHSLFIAFAPKDNPKIAIAVVVENGGYGNTYGTPIATLMIAKYLLREFERPPYEEDLFNASLISRY